MSHFNTLVLIPGETESQSVEPLVTELLEPYSEHLQVEAYETECGCIGFQALMDVQAAIAKEFDIHSMREQFQNLPKRQQTKTRWKKIIAPIEQKRNELLTAHPLVDKPNPECSDCNGTGVFQSHRNPDSRWDWWVIGGRWDGYLFGPEQQAASRDKDGGFNFGDDHHTPQNNCRRVSDIPIDDTHYVPFAIVTPEGEWVEQGAMGWWAHVSNEKDFKQWHEIVKTVLAKYPNHLAVAVDCHI